MIHKWLEASAQHLLSWPSWPCFETSCAKVKRVGRRNQNERCKSQNSQLFEQTCQVTHDFPYETHPSFAGFNAWTDVNYAAYKTVQSLGSNVNLATQNDSVAQYLKTAANAGFNTVRIFGHGNSSSFNLQKGPGNNHTLKSNSYFELTAPSVDHQICKLLSHFWLLSGHSNQRAILGYKDMSTTKTSRCIFVVQRTFAELLWKKAFRVTSFYALSIIQFCREYRSDA